MERFSYSFSHLRQNENFFYPKNAVVILLMYWQLVKYCDLIDFLLLKTTSPEIL